MASEAAWTAGGSVSDRRVVGLGADVGGSGRRGSDRSRLPASRLAKMAPNTAVPNDPPIMRKKVALEVAVPSSS